MSLLDKSIKHPQKRVSFAAGSIEQMSLISKRPEENQFNFDNPLNVFPQYEMPGHRLSLNALPSMHENQQPNAMEESLLNTNTGSTPTNRDMESQIPHYQSRTKYFRSKLSKFLNTESRKCFNSF